MFHTHSINKSILMPTLQDLANYTRQYHAWLNIEDSENIGFSISFDEACCQIFDDALVGNVLKAGKIIYNEQVTKAFKKLDSSIDVINGDRPQEEIIDAPLMEIVRQKAQKILDLMASTPMSDDAVPMIEPY